jgi:hypothetical protein
MGPEGVPDTKIYRLTDFDLFVRIGCYGLGSDTH